MATENRRADNPIAYDALLEMATRIGGRYVAWADWAPSEAVGRHWRNAGIEMQRQVRAVEAYDGAAVEAKRAELRALWATMPVQAPALMAVATRLATRDAAAVVPQAYPDNVSAQLEAIRELGEVHGSATVGPTPH